MVKVISLSDDAYRKLRALKRGKSFSEVVVELIGKRRTKKKNLLDFYGVWKEDSDYWEKMKKQIYEDRKKAKLRKYNW